MPISSYEPEEILELVRSRDGTTIACHRVGAGPPLLLVHGMATDHTRWRPVLPALAARFTVLACDRRGRGASGDAPGYELEREFEDVAALADAYGPIDVVAHAFGALCALEAARGGAAIRRLVLYEPPVPRAAADWPPEAAVLRIEEELQAADPGGAVATFLEEVTGVAADMTAYLRSLPSWRGREAAASTLPRELRALRRWRFDAAAYRGLELPTLLLRGAESPPPWHEGFERLRGVLPDARAVALPCQQHLAIDTGPEAFVRAILPFLLGPAT